MMANTDFGVAMVKARADTRKNLVKMANDLGTTPSFLSAMETGRKNISTDWVKKIESYFLALGVKINNLMELSVMSNQNIDIKEFADSEKRMIARAVGFAKSNLSEEERQEINDLFDKIDRMQSEKEKQ